MGDGGFKVESMPGGSYYGIFDVLLAGRMTVLENGRLQIESGLLYWV